MQRLNVILAAGLAALPLTAFAQTGTTATAPSAAPPAMHAPTTAPTTGPAKNAKAVKSHTAMGSQHAQATHTKPATAKTAPKS
jgi:hypothetical protein